MFTKKLKKAALAAVAVLAVGGSALAATPQETYKEAVNVMATHPEGTYTTELKGTMPFVGTMAVHQQSFVQLEPAAKAKVDMWISTSQGDTEKTSAYMEQKDASLVVYYPKSEQGKNKKDKTVWKKYTIPLKDSTPLAGIIRQEQHNGALNGVKSVTALGGDRYNVVYDVSRIYKPGDEKEWAKEGLTKKEDQELVKHILLALRDCGDLSAQVTIDPRSKRITHWSVPLTAQMRAVSSLITDEVAAQMPDKQAELAMVKQFILNSTISLDCDWSLLPQGMDLDAPQSVKNKAVEETDKVLRIENKKQ